MQSPIANPSCMTRRAQAQSQTSVKPYGHRIASSWPVNRAEVTEPLMAFTEPLMAWKWFGAKLKKCFRCVVRSGLHRQHVLYVTQNRVPQFPRGILANSHRNQEVPDKEWRRDTTRVSRSAISSPPLKTTYGQGRRRREDSRSEVAAIGRDSCSGDELCRICKVCVGRSRCKCRDAGFVSA